MPSRVRARDLEQRGQLPCSRRSHHRRHGGAGERGDHRLSRAGECGGFALGDRGRRVCLVAGYRNDQARGRGVMGVFRFCSDDRKESSMQQQSETGMNRTGARMSPALGEEMVKGAEQGGYTSPGDEHALELIRGDGQPRPPMGSPPPPASVKGMARAGLEAVKGNKASVLLDKLGERLAFERTGTRLYEGLLTKFDVFGTWEGGPTRDELQMFHDEEMAHFRLACEAIERMGGDPTAITPSADMVGVTSEGIVKVVADARSNLAESLEAVMVAELADNEGWEMLIGLTRSFGQDELAERFERALEEEQTHLVSVRRWLTGYATLDAKRELSSAARRQCGERRARAAGPAAFRISAVLVPWAAA